MTDERNCATCAHRHGEFREFWQCQATGLYCNVEARHGGDCIKKGKEFSLWQPRRSFVRRVIRFFVGAKG
jgi:hypothetical protein